MKNLYQKTGGFMKGVCHPTGDHTILHEAGIDWVRMDVPWPTEDAYTPFLQRVADYYVNGIRAILISPYPSRFIQEGIDPATPEGLLTVENLCSQMAAAFAPYHPCWQATNEMHIGHFRTPLTESQAVDFIAACIRGLKHGDPNAAVGHNSVNGDWLDHAALVDERAGGIDYIGLDLYAGTWTEGNTDTYLTEINRLHERLNRPVVLMEFGFASEGSCMEKGLVDMQHYMLERGFVQSDVQPFLQGFGFSRDEEAVARLDSFIHQLPAELTHNTETASVEERFQIARALIPHLMKKWPLPNMMPRSEVNQANFYGSLLPRLLEHPHLAGAVIFCMSDSERCFLCGEPDCPLETSWGLLRKDGTRKPSFDIIKRLFCS